MQRILDSIPERVWKALKGFGSLSYFTLLNLTIPYYTLPNLTKEFSDENLNSEKIEKSENENCENPF
jgi:hypothetical protein